VIIVHHLNNSRSQRVLWLLEELGLAYEIKQYKRQPNLLAPPELRAVHPLGKSPVITEDGLTVAESGAIVDYLLERHGGGRLAPAPGTPERLRFTYWMHYAEGSLMPVLLVALIAGRIAEAPFLVRPIAKAISGKLRGGFVDPQLTLHLDFIESELGKSAWFAGKEFTAADIQMSYPLEAAARRAKDAASRPRIKDWLQRIHARPAYLRALERGGKYELVN
jgi:glutathione S-transferase